MLNSLHNGYHDSNENKATIHYFIVVEKVLSEKFFLTLLFMSA